MAGFLSKIFGGKELSVIGVDIGPSSIKVVELKKQKGKAILKTYGALALGPYAGIEVGRATHLPPEKIAEALLDLLREANTSTKLSGLSIPMSSSLLTVIEVPTLDPKQLAQIIPIEARKYIPVPITEVALDWMVIPKEQVGLSDFENADDRSPQSESLQKKTEKAEVMLVVIHNDAIAQTQEIIKLSNLQTSFFEVEIFSTIRAVLDRETEPVMIFDMGAGSTKLYIVDRGILKNSHIITRGSQDLTLAISKSMGMSIEEAEVLKRSKGLLIGANAPNADNQQGSLMGGENRINTSGTTDVMNSTLNFLFSEANRVILNYQKKYNKNIHKVILTGGGVALKGFLELAKSNLQTDVVPADPFAKIEAPAFLANVLKQAGPEFAVAVGLAIRKLQEIS
jgi:type IV pilus assembly protein PilM